MKGNVKTTIPHPRLMEETDKTLALKVIKELSVSPSQWQYMSLFLYDYIEGERDVNGEYEETFKKIMAFFEKHQIPSTKKYAIINEMDRIVQDIHSTPIRDLVRFKNEQIKTQKLELKRGK